MNSDFIGSDCSSNLPSTIDTLDDAIRYLQEARKVVGGDTKFRIVGEYEENDSDEYRMLNDVIIKGRKSLMKKKVRHNDNDNESFVLFVH